MRETEFEVNSRKLRLNMNASINDLIKASVELLIANIQLSKEALNVHQSIRFN